jgi:autotransporter-associated beta strand protein
MKNGIDHTGFQGARSQVGNITFLFLLAGAVLWPGQPSLAADRRWTGNASGLWSNPNNWSPVGTPLNGEHVLFEGDGRTTQNDLSGLSLSTLEFLRGEWRITGNELMITASIPVGKLNDDSEENLITIDCPLILGGDVTSRISWGRDDPVFDNPNHVTFRGPINLNGHEFEVFLENCGCGPHPFASILGAVSGNGTLRVSSLSRNPVEIGGPEPNTFIGPLVCELAGGVTLNKQNGPAVNTMLDVDCGDPVTVKSSGQIAPGATVRIGAGSRLRLEGHDVTFTDLDLGSLGTFNVGEPVSVVDMQGATVTLLGNLRSRAFLPTFTEGNPATPVLEGRVVLPNGTHTFDIYRRDVSFYGLELRAELTGSGGFTKIGDAALLLETNNSFTGSVEVNEGIVEAGHALAFGTAAGGVTLTGNGSLTLDNVRINSETLFVRGTRSVTANTDGSFLHGVGNLPGWMGRIELDTDLVVLSDDLCVLGGPVVGPGGFEFLGQQNVLFGSGLSSAPSTYTGTVRVLCDLLTVFGDRAFRGPLIVGGGFGSQCEVRWGNSTLNSGVPEVTVHPNGLVNLDGRGETFTRLIMHGGRVTTGTGFVSVARIITNPTNVTATIEGTLVLGSTPFTEFIVADGPASPDLAIDAVIADGLGQTSIHKLGDGELLLSGVNTYDGETQVRAGLVHVSNNAALGGAAVGTTVSDGATLRIESVPALPEPLNIRGTGRADVGAVLDLMAATGVQAGIVLAGPSTVRVDTQFAILSGVISGTGPFTKIGAGALQFGGGSGLPNSYSGNTLVRAGVLVPAKGNNVTTIPGHLVIGGGGALSEIPAVVRHAASFTIGGSVTVDRGGLWDLNGLSESFDVALLQGGPALTLNRGGDVQTGAGTLTLPPGDVPVSPGAGSPAPSSSISGNLALQPGTHRFIVESGAFGAGSRTPELIVSAAVGEQPLGAANLVKEGGGTMRLSGANSFTGSMTVNDGELIASHALALGTAAGGTLVNGNASLTLEGGIEIAGETLTLDSANDPALLSSGPVTNTWGGAIVLQRTAGIRVPDTRGAFTHFGGVGTFDSAAISGPGGFTKTGPGAMFITGLTGGNTYTGQTTVNEGVLEALRSGRNLSGNIVVSGATAVLRTGRPGSIFTGARTVLPAGASMAVQDGGLWAMNGTNFETISRLVGNGNLTVSTAGALTISNDVSCEFSGQLSGTGALNKLGLATFQLTGNSPGYTGPATVFDGTYKVDGQILNSPITVKVGSTLRGTGAVGDVVAENGGVVKVDPDGPGQSGGELVMNSVNFQNGSVLGLGFHGPHPTGGHDHLFVNNAVTLTSSTLSSGFQYAPRDGDVITLVNFAGAGAVSGAFGGFPEGALRNIDGIPVVMSYVGGSGNDVTLTVTNLPFGGGGAALVTGGGGALGPDDCSELRIVVTNRGASTLTNVRGALRSLTPGVLVTRAESAYPNLAPNARGTNAEAFQIRTEPTFPCGGSAQFELVITSAEFPPTAIAYTLPGASGFGLNFDGVNDRVQLPVNAFPAVVNNFTIELWANPTATRSETAETNTGVSGFSISPRQLQRFAVFPDRGDLSYGATHAGAGLSIGRNGVSAYEHSTNAPQGIGHLPSRLVYSNSLSGWTHVALVYTNRRPRLYINGVLERSSSVQSLFPSVHPSGSLGGSSQGSFGNFDGQLDEVRIWSTALTAEQIQTNMLRSLTGNEPNLVTYFRCDAGSGTVLTDNAPASPNPSGTLTGGAAFVMPGVVPFGPACQSGGACESCFVVSGRFDTNALESVRRLNATGLPSLCDPPKPCPDFTELPDAPVRHVLHHFTNSTAAELCATAQLRYDCPSAPPGTIGVAAYLGEFRINQPCSSFLGDDGAFGPPAPPFSFLVPPLTNIVLVVTARDTNFLCATYALELFGLPCPPPTLHITRDAAPDKVRLEWSSAYPDYRLQSANSLNNPGPSSFGNVATPPALSGGKFAVTNAVATPRQFFQLAK